MRIVLLVGMFLFLAMGSVQAQDAEKDTVLAFTEVMPEFPGGQDGLVKFLVSNVKYPREAIKKDISGKVYVEFVVEKNGALSNVKVRKGVHESLDEEAVRVVESMPQWKPGYQKGKPVRVTFVLPIVFKLK